MELRGLWERAISHTYLYRRVRTQERSVVALPTREESVSGPSRKKIHARERAHSARIDGGRGKMKRSARDASRRGRRLNCSLNGVPDLLIIRCRRLPTLLSSFACHFVSLFPNESSPMISDPFGCRRVCHRAGFHD